MTPEQKKKIAFIKVGLNSYLNNAVGKMLRVEFPEYSVCVYDVTHDIFGGSFQAVLTSAFSAIRQYGLQAFKSRNSLFNNFYTTGYFKAVRRLIQRKLNSEDFLFSFQTQSLFDASLPGLPHFVYTDHVHLANLGYPGFDRKNLAPQAWIELEREIYRNAAMVLTMSSNISRSLIEEYGIAPSRVACVGAGCDLDVDCKRMDSVRRESKNILFVGTDWRRKGGPELLTAFEKIKMKHPDATLTIVGCVPDSPLPAGVSVLGRVNHGKVIDYYCSSDVFCLPTKLEPFGLVILEAMAFGIPVVATDIGAIPDMVEHEVNGLLSEPGDILALADNLDRLLVNPGLRQRYGAHGRSRFENRYTWRAAGKNIRDAISRCMGTDLPRLPDSCE